MTRLLALALAAALAAGPSFAEDSAASPATSVPPVAAGAPAAIPESAPAPTSPAPEPSPAGAPPGVLPAAPPPPPPPDRTLRPVEVARLAIPPPPRGDSASWYRPTPPGKGDAELPWNRSILGSFDPFTSDKLVLAYARQPVSFALPKAEGKVSYTVPPTTPGGTSTEQKHTYPATTFAGTFSGARLLWGEWSLTGAVSSARLGALPLTAYALTLARSTGAWAAFDLGSPDVRLGLAWPEFFLRVIYASLDADLPRHPGVQEALLSVGLTLGGLRLTVADSLYFELRAGELATFANVAVVDWKADKEDLVLRKGSGLSWKPLLLVGLAL